MNISYIRSGDYFIPDLKLSEETRPIGKWGRMYRDYLKEHHPIRFNTLVLTGNLWAYLADLNEQAQRLKAYMLTHFFDTGDSDCRTVLNQLYRAYAESHENDPQEIGDGFKELEEYRYQQK